MKKYLKSYFNIFAEARWNREDEITESSILLGLIFIPLTIPMIILFSPLKIIARWINKTD